MPQWKSSTNRMSPREHLPINVASAGAKNTVFRLFLHVRSGRGPFAQFPLVRKSGPSSSARGEIASSHVLHSVLLTTARHERHPSRPTFIAAFKTSRSNILLVNQQALMICYLWGAIEYVLLIDVCVLHTASIHPYRGDRRPLQQGGKSVRIVQ